MNDKYYFLCELLDQSTKNQYDNFVNLYKSICENSDFKCEKLFEIENDSVITISNIKKNDGSNIFISSGFHGNEPAGCWAILKFLQQKNDFLNKVNVTFLPLYNPTGFKKGIRKNGKGEDPNRGFPDDPSIEGQHLMSKIDFIKNVSKDGFLTLHENKKEKFYLKEFTKDNIDIELVEKIRDVGEKFFGIIESYKNTKIKDGISNNFYPNSFEDFLVKEGIPICICTETPGFANFNERVNCGAEIIESFISYFI